MSKPSTPAKIARAACIFVAAALLLTACAPATRPTSLAGTWSGTWRSAHIDQGGNVSATFTHVGNTLSGSVALAGSPCLATGTLSGTVDGQGVSFGAIGSDDEVEFAGRLTGENTLAGTYSVSAGMCEGDNGEFTVTRDVN